ncbi:hypothetical protein ACOMHN_062206 [Nucella lapillus]
MATNTAVILHHLPTVTINRVDTGQSTDLSRGETGPGADYQPRDMGADSNPQGAYKSPFLSISSLSATSGIALNEDKCPQKVFLTSTADCLASVSGPVNNKCVCVMRSGPPSRDGQHAGRGTDHCPDDPADQ